jgi:hypothetical protein
LIYKSAAKKAAPFGSGNLQEKPEWPPFSFIVILKRKGHPKAAFPFIMIPCCYLPAAGVLLTASISFYSCASFTRRTVAFLFSCITSA